MFKTFYASGAIAGARVADSVAPLTRSVLCADADSGRAGRIKAIVFDTDGTLSDSQATWGAWCEDKIDAEAGNDPILARQLAMVIGCDTATKHIRVDRVIASTTEELAEHLLPLLPTTIKAEIGSRINRRTATAAQIEAAPLRALLTNLADNRLYFGLATNDVEASTCGHLGASDIEDLFQFIACLDGGWGAKPDPGQLTAFMQVTGLTPEDCVMVGDSLHDLHAARAAGMRAVAVFTGLSDRETFEPAADVVLNSVAELPEWITTDLAELATVSDKLCLSKAGDLSSFPR